MNLLASTPKTMSSREIATLCGKKHRNVMRDVRGMLNELHAGGSAQIRADPSLFLSTYTDEQNGQRYREFLLPKRETLILVSGYNVLVRAKIIDRWQEIEAAVAAPAIPQSFSEALRLAAALADRVQEAHAALAEAQPKADALDRIATASEGAVCLRMAAKLLQVPEREFLGFAQAKRFIFRSRSGSPWQGYADKAKAGLVEQKLTKVQRPDGSEKHVEQVLITAAGIAKMAALMGRGVAA